jgi:GT2 family glycosyltransferase
MLYILLPVHNRKKTTKLFLDCLKKQTFQNFQIILIDDGSTDDTDKLVLSYYPYTKILYGDGNLWWAGSLQKAFDYLLTISTSNQDTILIINDDTVFDKNYLKYGVSLLSKLNKVMLKSWVEDVHTNKIGDGYIYANIKKFTFSETKNINLCNCSSTRGLFIKAKDFFDLNGFMPDKLPHYFSDYEFTYRAYKHNYKIICDDQLKLISDSQNSGFHIIRYKSFLDFIKQYFSIKCPANPKYQVRFVLLVSNTLKSKFFNITSILIKAFAKIIFAFIFLFFNKSLNVSNFQMNFKKK